MRANAYRSQEVGTRNFSNACVRSVVITLAVLKILFLPGCHVSASPCASDPEQTVPEGICHTDESGKRRSRACGDFLPLVSDDGNIDSSLSDLCLAGPKFEHIRNKGRGDKTDRDFIPTIEIRDWSSHAIQSTMLRILLEEVLGYEHVRVIYRTDPPHYRSRAIDQSCSAIDIEVWNKDEVDLGDGSVLLSFLGVVGRDALFVPQNFSIAASNYQILEEGLSFQCQQQDPSSTDPGGEGGDGGNITAASNTTSTSSSRTVSSYSLYPAAGSTNMSALFGQDPASLPCNNNTPQQVGWTSSQCVDGAWIPPQCEGGDCRELYLVSPLWNTGWYEAVIRNLNLDFHALYIGMQAIQDKVHQYHSSEGDGRGIVYFWWEPSVLHIKYPAKVFTLPEFSETCKAGYSLEPLSSSVDCNVEHKPLMKAFPAHLKLQEPDLYHLWNAFTSSWAIQLDLMKKEGPAMGGPGNLTVEQVACEWLRNNTDIWEDWIRTEDGTSATSSSDRKYLIVLYTVVPIMGGVLIVVLFLLWRQTHILKRELSNTVGVMHKPILDLEAPLNKAINTLTDIIDGNRVVSKTELQGLTKMLTTAGNIATPNLNQLLKSDSTYYSQDAIGFIMHIGNENTGHSPVPSRLRTFSRNNRPTGEVEEEGAGDTPVFVGDSAIESFNERWTFFGALTLSADSHSSFTAMNLPPLEESNMGDDFKFDTIKLASNYYGKPLVVTAMHLIETKFGLVSRLKLNKKKLILFLNEVERGYSDKNPYHNNTHAADVTQRFATIFSKCRLHENGFCDLELLIGLLAAILHDLDHPGTNNMFQVNCRSLISLQFNDQHVLENHSLYTGLSLLEAGKETNFLDGPLSSGQQKTLRAQLISLVLATDMAEHFHVLTTFKAKMLATMTKEAALTKSTKRSSFKSQTAANTVAASGSSLSESRLKEGEKLSDEEKLLILKMVLKCADIGHVTLPVDLHLHWVKSLQEEFYKQGDKEREQRRPISFLCDRNKLRGGPAHGENQLGFLDVICEPMYDALVKLFPVCEELMENLQANRRYWESEVYIEDVIVVQ